MQGFNIVFYAQTYFGIPIWEMGLSINIKTDPNEVVRCISTFSFDDIGLSTPETETLNNYNNISNTELATLLNTDLADSISITESGNLYIYQYLSEKRFNDSLKSGNITWYDTDDLPDVHDTIEESGFYLVREVLFSFSNDESIINWRCLIELNTGSILYLEVGLHFTDAYVYEHDPITLGANPTPLDPSPLNIINATTSTLNQYRSTVTLNNLEAPSYNVNPNVLHQQLRGTYVKILDAITDVGNPALQPLPSSTPSSRPYSGEPPSEPSPYHFYYGAGTDAFSAVCIYYHIDNFFSTLVNMGFTFFGTNPDFPNTPMPLPVDHWANGNSGLGSAALGTTFCYGVAFSRLVSDTENTNVAFLGSGTSHRIILHELSHVLLLDRIQSGNFHFAHSFGDSLAAILSDPFTLCPEVTPDANYDRYSTLPWDGSGSITSSQLMLARRHGRYVSGTQPTSAIIQAIDSGGWYWGGAFDPSTSGDYNNYSKEQILTTTLFLAYKALGGDSYYSQTERLVASQMMILLIIKTVKNYSAQNNYSPNASQKAMDFSEDIIANDRGIASINYPLQLTMGAITIPLGASHKVIRWAFERQGAYYFVPVNQYPSPYTNYNPPPFPPPLIDICIYNGEIGLGQYAFYNNFWSSPDIYNRNQQDGITNQIHQNPIQNSNNYIYVRVKSIGQSWPSNFVTKIYKSSPGGGNVWPQDWTQISSDIVSLFHHQHQIPQKLL